MSLYLSQRGTEPARIHAYPKRRRQPRYPGLDAPIPAPGAPRDARGLDHASQPTQPARSATRRRPDTGPSYADFFREDASALASEVA